ncbi:MAG: DUF721 domain-containing protein [Deltaproteobacteria bacterium]|nr:DUF721 domain-containing protein [Deltaproteobacteria bacterium]
MRERQRRVCAMDEALGLTLNTPEAALELAIARLWRHWPEIFGTDMAEMIRPLGRRKTTMLLGTTNSMVMQEFSFLGPEILEKANTFLGTNYFQELKLELMSGRPPLDESLLPIPSPSPTPPLPEPLGNLLPCMDPSSPVTACYRAYVKLFRPDLATTEPSCVDTPSHG